MTKKTSKTRKKAARKAPARAAKTARPAMSKRDLLAIRKELLSQRDDVLQAMRRNKAIEITSDTGDEADQAAASMDRDLQFELSDTERNTLDQIEGAIRKIDKGTYGACEQCRQPIETVRIRALPFVRYCIRCQSGSERAVTATQA